MGHRAGCHACLRSADLSAGDGAAIGFHRPKTFGRTTIAATPSAGMTTNHKRGSKFTLPDKATMLSFAAYLDGLGATSGSQAVRMAIYKDNNGVPGSKWAQSNVVTIAAGSAGWWVNFTAPATPLDPGANWYGNADLFSDGPSNPFGTGTSGSGTLSVKITYTVGY